MLGLEIQEIVKKENAFLRVGLRFCLLLKGACLTKGSVGVAA
jgi:hypothetical protein